MKINIKNLLFQPLALHLAADGEGLHLSARECKEILAEHVSDEIRKAADRGFLSLLEQRDPRGDDAPGEHTDEPVGSLETRPTQRRRRER